MSFFMGFIGFLSAALLLAIGIVIGYRVGVKHGKAVGLLAGRIMSANAKRVTIPTAQPTQTH